jgi:hypothetical protein
MFTDLKNNTQNDISNNANLEAWPYYPETNSGN